VANVPFEPTSWKKSIKIVQHVTSRIRPQTQSPPALHGCICLIFDGISNSPTRSVSATQSDAAMKKLSVITGPCGCDGTGSSMSGGGEVLAATGGGGLHIHLGLQIKIHILALVPLVWENLPSLRLSTQVGSSKNRVEVVHIQKRGCQRSGGLSVWQKRYCPRKRHRWPRNERLRWRRSDEIGNGYPWRWSVLKDLRKPVIWVGHS
jgi:hypothetical protein